MASRAPRGALALLAVLLLSTASHARDDEPKLSESERRDIVAGIEKRILPPGPRPQDGELLLTFYVMGDSRAGGESKILFIDVTDNEFDTAVLGEMVQRITTDIETDQAAHPGLPTFVFHTGDMVRRGDDQGEWEHFARSIAPLVTRKDLDVSYLPVLGNHEYSTEDDLPWREALAPYGLLFGGEIEGVPVVKDAVLSRAFGGPDPARWYHLRCGNTEFIVLDSCSANYGAVSEHTAGWPPQLADLRAWLAAIDPAEVRNVFLFQHHPLFSNGAGHPDTDGGTLRVPGSDKRYRTSEMAEHILRRRLMHAILNEFYDNQGRNGARLRGVFSGHNHTYERIVIPPSATPGWESALDLGATFLTDGNEGETFSDYIRDELKLSTTFSSPEDQDVALRDREVRMITSGGAGAPHGKKGGLFRSGEDTHRAIGPDEKAKLYEKRRFDRWYPDYYRYRFAMATDTEEPQEVRIDRGLEGEFVPLADLDWVRRLGLLERDDLETFGSPLSAIPLDWWRSLYAKKIPRDTEQYHYIKVAVYENALHLGTSLKYGDEWIIADYDVIATRAPQ